MRRPVLILTALSQCLALAQMCDPNPPPPCRRLHPGAMLFVGTALGGRPVRFQISEIFLGLPAGTKEIEVDGGFLDGHTYLIDAFKNRDSFELTSCGATADVTSGLGIQVLDFLRTRASLPASLTVHAFDVGKPIPLVDVRISSSENTSTARTDDEGVAHFESLQPGTYDITASRDHYRVSIDHFTETRIEVIPGACPLGFVDMFADSTASGLAVDSKGAPLRFLDLDLVEMADPPRRFETRTDGRGRFKFEFVSPGKYWLGANLTEHGTTGFPPTYYPGTLNRTDASPIEVSIGVSLSGLRLTMPELGGQLTVEICATKDPGLGVADVRILNARLRGAPPRASLDETMMTDETGCVTTTGHAKVQYAVRASKRFYDGTPTLESDVVVIEPGDQPAHVRLVLKPTK